jgi:hypothetical protein
VTAENATSSNASTTVAVCLACSEFCESCNGTRNLCLSCPDGFVLTNQSLCIPTQHDFHKDEDEKSNSTQLVFLVIAMSVCFAALSLFILIFGILQIKDGECFRRKRSYMRASSKEDSLDRMVIPNIEAINGLNAEMAAQSQGLLDASDSENEYSADITDPQMVQVKMMPKC